MLCPKLEFNRSAYAAIAAGASPHKLFVAVDRIRVGVYGDGIDVADDSMGRGTRFLFSGCGGGWYVYFSEDTREKGLTLVRLHSVRR